MTTALCGTRSAFCGSQNATHTTLTVANIVRIVYDSGIKFDTRIARFNGFNFSTTVYVSRFLTDVPVCNIPVTIFLYCRPVEYGGYGFAEANIPYFARNDRKRLVRTTCIRSTLKKFTRWTYERGRAENRKRPTFEKRRVCVSPAPNTGPRT